MSDAYYYNVEAQAVETGPSKRGFSETRLGPYPSESEASRALETLHRRNAEADETERSWREG